MGQAIWQGRRVNVKLIYRKQRFVVRLVAVLPR